MMRDVWAAMRPVRFDPSLMVFLGLFAVALAPGFVCMVVDAPAWLLPVWVVWVIYWVVVAFRFGNRRWPT